MLEVFDGEQTPFDTFKKSLPERFGIFGILVEQDPEGLFDLGDDFVELVVFKGGCDSIELLHKMIRDLERFLGKIALTRTRNMLKKLVQLAFKIIEQFVFGGGMNERCFGGVGMSGCGGVGMSGLCGVGIRGRDGVGRCRLCEWCVGGGDGFGDSGGGGVGESGRDGFGGDSFGESGRFGSSNEVCGFGCEVCGFGCVGGGCALGDAGEGGFFGVCGAEGAEIARGDGVVGVVEGDVWGFFGGRIGEEGVGECGFSGELALEFLFLFLDLSKQGGDGGHGEHGLFGKDVGRGIFGVCGAFVVFVSKGDGACGWGLWWCGDAVEIGSGAFGAWNVDVEDRWPDLGEKFVKFFDLGDLVGFIEIDDRVFFGAFLMRRTFIVISIDEDDILGGWGGWDIGGVG